MDEIVSAELNEIMQALDNLKNLSEEDLTESTMARVMQMLETNFNGTAVMQSVNQIISNLNAQGLNKEEAINSLDALSSTLKELVYGEEVLTGNKKILIDKVMSGVQEIFDTVKQKYHSYSIELPIKLDNGATMPTYAHPTDAAADLYALENVTVPAHSYGNKIRTGVSIQLPEGWMAFILPRSSIGAKTPLRLSNSVGLIDSSYRGELGVLYDNTSNEDYPIEAGARIAQLLVMPNDRFQAHAVDILAASDRNDGGFGSTGV